MHNLDLSVDKESGMIIVGPGQIGRAFLTILVHDIGSVLGGIDENKELDMSSLDTLVGMKTREVGEMILTLQDHPRDDTLILQEQEKRNSKAGTKFFPTNHHHNTKPRAIPKKSFQSRKK